GQRAEQLLVHFAGDVQALAVVLDGVDGQRADVLGEVASAELVHAAGGGGRQGARHQQRGGPAQAARHGSSSQMSGGYGSTCSTVRRVMRSSRNSARLR